MWHLAEGGFVFPHAKREVNRWHSAGCRVGSTGLREEVGDWNGSGYCFIPRKIWRGNVYLKPPQ